MSLFDEAVELLMKIARSDEMPVPDRIKALDRVLSALSDRPEDQPTDKKLEILVDYGFIPPTEGKNEQ